MDKLNRYREHVRSLLTQRGREFSSRDGVETQLIFDREHDHYQLVRTGWRDSTHRVYGCLLHVDIKDDKIWVQHDGTEVAIADQLVALGVPKQDIVLVYHAPNVRQYTEFALG
ncbi:MAG: XisI protein [Leptolyngbya sp. SIOISBB]|nr:XisI protein [Leptolyngbya sp. SIOISBB]